MHVIEDLELQCVFFATPLKTLIHRNRKTPPYQQVIDSYTNIRTCNMGLY